MSSKKLPLAEIREKYKRMAIAGDVRGFEAVPFTVIGTGDNSVVVGSTSAIDQCVPDSIVGIVEVGSIIYIENSSGIYEERKLLNTFSGGKSISFSPPINGRKADSKVVFTIKQTHKQANPTWTDIIGSPANIAATFPEGVEGQWIPEIPDGTSKTFPLNRKATAATSTVPRVLTQNNGVSWVTDNISMSSTTNKMTSGAPAATVWLSSYETQAHFTEDSNNVKVLDLGGVHASNFSSVAFGASLTASLISKVPTDDSGSGHPTYLSVALMNLGEQMPSTGVLIGNRSLPTHSVLNLSGTSKIGRAHV
jgi:hypothetical protein